MEDQSDLKIGKITIILILALIVGVILMILFNRSDGYLIINETIVLSKSGNSIKKVSEYKDEIFKEKFHIVGDFGEMDDVILNRSSFGQWNYMDKNYKSLDVKKVSLAYNGNFKNVKLADYDFSYYNSDYDSILSQALGDRKLSKFKESIRISSYDFNGDGKKENIFTLTNANTGVSKDDMYSLLFLESNGKVIKINSDNNDQFMVRSILDLDNDGKYEIVVSKGSFDISLVDDNYQIYKINGSSFKCIMNS